MLDCGYSSKAYLGNFDLDTPTQRWRWLSDELIAIDQEGSELRLEAYNDGYFGMEWKNGGNNQKFYRIMSGKLGKYYLTC